jgi:uncharacterized membrane protein
MDLIKLSKSKQINWGCHGIPERCFKIKGRQMKICARCVGCNIGHALAILAVIFQVIPVWPYSIVFITIMMLDWALQFLFKVMSNNKRRLFTGVFGGLGMGILIWGLVFKVIKLFI